MKRANIYWMAAGRIGLFGSPCKRETQNAGIAGYSVRSPGFSRYPVPAANHSTGLGRETPAKSAWKSLSRQPTRGRGKNLCASAGVCPVFILLLVGISLSSFVAVADENLASSFQELCSAKAKSAFVDSKSVVPGRNDWFFLASELRHMGAGPFWGDAAANVSQASKPDYADPLPAILDFNEQLKQAGVQLIFVPVPPKAVIYPEKVASSVDASSGRLDPDHQQFYEMLREQGVEVVDLVPAFTTAKESGTDVYCRTDSHWSGSACETAAGLLASMISDQEWAAAIPKTEWASEVRDVTIQGDLGKLPGGEAVEDETLKLTFIGIDDGSGGVQAIEDDETSPILLFGDSHNLVFHAGDDMHAKGAGLADHLKKATGINIDVLGVRGSGATPSRISLMRRCRRNPEYLSNKKVVIWCLSAREFTEGSGWRKVPLQKK